MKKQKKSKITSLWSMVEAMQNSLEVRGLGADVVDATVVRWVTGMCDTLQVYRATRGRVPDGPPRGNHHEAAVFGLAIAGKA
ncbi:MAG: hypothetical protein AAGC55_21940 [Myxococcota bacterium]